MLADKREVVRILQEAVEQHPQAIEQSTPTTFAEFVSDLQNHPRDRARRDHVVELAAALPTLPPIPEDVQQRYERATALIQQSGGPQRLNQAMNLLRGALNAAPWWRDPYYQLSRALKLSGQYDLALKNLNYYLELHPPEAEARVARDHLLEIQTKMEAASPKEQ
jgi:tetratricopeptide (TPR) repeat protein